MKTSAARVAFVPGYHLRCFTLIWLGLGYLYVGSLEQAARNDFRGRGGCEEPVASFHAGIGAAGLGALSQSHA